MIWYFFTILGIIFTVLSFRVSKAPERTIHSKILGWDKICGNHVATVIWASVTLTMILGSLVDSSPGRKKRKKIRLHSETTVQQALGQCFAERFGKLMKPGSTILLINQIKGEADKRLHQGFKTGFTKWSNANNINLKEEVIIPQSHAMLEEAAFTETLLITSRQFDEIVEKNNTCSAIISLVGLPDNYESSRTWELVSNGKILLGILTDDVFLLGGMIVNNEITACVVPKRRYEFYEIFPGKYSAESIFSIRFHYITAENIIEVMKQDRRIFKILRRI